MNYTFVQQVKFK